MTSNKLYAPYGELTKGIGWLLAAKLAEWLGMNAGIIQSEDGEKTAVIIDLPSGQVHAVLPSYIIEGRWKRLDESKYADRDYAEELQSIMDCLNGILMHKTILAIPEQKEEIK